ncbi:uncharacterized protein LOC133926665 [Phragmites australis]|uniref:uncharacterized protein LOC133926665 n=1 Tax=Phragmites australis TaxID=29695 RepID=UPI002D7878C8|nr:uncharacterized protein LOC133926665 [Phragmites australis]
MSEVQSRVLIVGCQGNPGSDTCIILGGDECCVPILWLAFDLCHFTVLSQRQSSEVKSFSDKDLMHFGKPGELDGVFVPVSWAFAKGNPRRWCFQWIKAIICYIEVVTDELQRLSNWRMGPTIQEFWQMVNTKVNSSV